MPEHLSKNPQIDRVLLAFHDGDAAKRAGHPCVVPPGLSKDERRAWLNGWQGARRIKEGEEER